MFAQAQAQVELRPAAGPRRRGLWLLVAAVSALFVVGAVAVPVFGWVAEQTSTSTWTSAHAVSAVRVEVGSGSVSFGPGPAGSVSMVENLTWNLSRPTVSEQWQGNTLVVREDCPGHSPFAVDECGVNVRLTVPGSVSVQAVADSGDVTVTGLSGAVHAQASSGDVNLTADSGYIWARTESGSVTADGLRSQWVDAAVSSGDLYLGFADVPTTVNATAQSGDATVVVPQGSTYRVSGQSGSGDRAVEGGVQDASSPRSLTVDTSSGDARIGYPDEYGR